MIRDDIDRMLDHARKQADRLKRWRRNVKDHVFVAEPEDEAELVRVLLDGERAIRAMADGIGRLVVELADAERVNREIVCETGYVVVPCVEHPILDVIAKAIEPEFAHGRPDDIGPAENVRRESECVEFRDTRTGQRFEVVVRLIEEEKRS